MMKTMQMAVLAAALALGACGDRSEQAQQGAAPDAGDREAGPASTGVTAGVAEPAQALAQGAAGNVEEGGGDLQQTAQEVAETVESAQPAAEQALQAAVDEGAQRVQQAATAGAAALAGAQTADSPAPAKPAMETSSVETLDLARGKQVYSANCMACHGTGAAGAPKLEDAANWKPRVEQGMDVLFKHALEGFQGARGYMPPKGGFASLGDEDVKAAVAYMVDRLE